MHNESILMRWIVHFCLGESATLLGDEVYSNSNGFVPVQKEANSCEPDNSDDDFNTPPPSFTPVYIPVDVEQHTKPTPLPASTQNKSKLKSKKVSQHVVLEMQYEVLKMQKEMILLKNEKLKLQVAELKERANGSRLISSVENL